MKLITELGIRYEPSVQADLQAHATRVALLASDLADCNPAKLAAAIARWVSFKPFLPKASELRYIVNEIDTPAKGAKIDFAERYNHRLADQGKGNRLRWRYKIPGDLDSELILESVDEPPMLRKLDLSPAEIEATHAVTAKLLRDGVPPHEFEDMVRRGIVTRMVENRMAAP